MSSMVAGANLSECNLNITPYDVQIAFRYICPSTIADTFLNIVQSPSFLQEYKVESELTCVSRADVRIELQLHLKSHRACPIRDSCRCVWTHGACVLEGVTRSAKNSQFLKRFGVLSGVAFA